MLRQLKIKFIAITMILVSIILLFVFTLMYQSNVKATYDKSVEDLKTISTLDISKFSEPQTNKVLKELQFVPLFIVNIDESGVILSQIKSNISMDNESFKSIVKIAHESQDDIGTIKSMDIRYYRKHYSLYDKISFIDISRDNTTLDNLFVVFIMTGVMTLIFFFFIILFLSNWALLPVEKTWSQQKQFIADASHELKTPLTVIINNVGNIQKAISKNSIQIENMELLTKNINGIDEMSERMKHLTQDLLDLSRLENWQDRKEQMGKIVLSDIATKECLYFEPVFFENNKELDYNIEDNISILGDANKIRDLISILLENAMKYSLSHTTLTLNKRKKDIVLSVENDVEKELSKEDTVNIFKRFYRLDESHSGSGYGLGLPIAKEIVLMHKGEIKVVSKDKKVFFEIYFHI